MILNLKFLFCCFKKTTLTMFHRVEYFNRRFENSGCPTCSVHWQVFRKMAFIILFRKWLSSTRLPKVLWSFGIVLNRLWISLGCFNSLRKYSGQAKETSTSYYFSSFTVCVTCLFCEFFRNLLQSIHLISVFCYFIQRKVVYYIPME